MYGQHAERFQLLDEPSAASVSLLIRRLQNDSTTKGVSPKNYAHRSRVIRQQTERLALQVALNADLEAKQVAKRMRKACRPLDHREEGGEG
jgi:hypothetical protein